MSQDVDISVVLCTRDRAALLTRSLEAFAALDTQLCWELVVVDNGSSDDTVAVLDSCASDMPQLHVVTESQAGLGRARNSGACCARGDLLAFTDDDCIPAPDYLDLLFDVFAERPGAGFVGGRVLLRDPRDARLTVATRERPLSIAARTFVPAGLLHGANLAFRRSVLNHIGGFDERFGLGALFCCDDVDAVARAVWSGVHGLYHPGPTVFHAHGRRTRPDVRAALRRYDAGRGAYYATFLSYPEARPTYARHWLVRSLVRAPWRVAREVASARACLRSGPPMPLPRPLDGGWTVVSTAAQPSTDPPPGEG